MARTGRGLGRRLADQRAVEIQASARTIRTMIPERLTFSHVFVSVDRRHEEETRARTERALATWAATSPSHPVE